MATKGSKDRSSRQTKPRATRETTSTAFARRLLTAIRARRMANGLVYRLDLRGREWEDLPLKGSSRLITLFDPDSPGWPEDGRTTSEQEVAKRWVREHYAEWLERQERLAQESSDPDLTVRQACEQYLEALKGAVNEDHNTYKNRYSACHVHLIPKFGNLPLASLRRKKVRSFLARLRVRKHASHRVMLHPAAIATKRNVQAALVAVWNHVYQDEAAPFGGIKLNEKNASAKRRAAAKAGDVDDLVGAKAYTNEEVLRLLIKAACYDRDVMGLRRLSVTYLANVTAGIAFILGTGARIEEATFVRWKHVDWEAGVIFIPGTKTENAPRWVPIPDALRPWLERLRALAGDSPDLEEFILQIRCKRPREQSSDSTWGNRIARVQKAAGLKVKQKAAHILRSTYLTRTEEMIGTAATKQYAGHGSARGGATDQYIDRRPPFIPPEHRTFLRLPHPDFVAVLAAAQSYKSLALQPQASDPSPDLRHIAP